MKNIHALKPNNLTRPTSASLRNSILYSTHTGSIRASFDNHHKTFSQVLLQFNAGVPNNDMDRQFAIK